MKNPIRTKLALGIGSILATMAMSTGYATFQLGSAADLAVEVEARTYRIAGLASDLELHVVQV